MLGDTDMLRRGRRTDPADERAGLVCGLAEERDGGPRRWNLGPGAEQSTAHARRRSYQRILKRSVSSLGRGCGCAALVGSMRPGAWMSTDRHARLSCLRPSVFCLLPSVLDLLPGTHTQVLIARSHHRAHAKALPSDLDDWTPPLLARTPPGRALLPALLAIFGGEAHMALGTTRGAVLIPSIASHQLRSSLGDPAAPAPAPALARDQLEQTRSGVPFRASPQPRPLSRPQAPTAELTQQPDIVLLSSDDESDLTSVEEWDGHETQRGSPARGGAHADATVPDPLPDDTNGLAHIADERQRGRERVSGIGGASRPASTLNVGDDVGATTTPDVGIGTLHDGRRLTNLGLERVSYEPVATVIQPPSDSAQAQGQVPVQTPTVVGASRLPEAISISDDDDDDEVASATETTHAQPTTFPAVNFETAHLNPAFPFLAVPPPPMPTTLASTSLLPTSAFPAISGPQASQAPANMNITASMSTSAAPLAQRDNDLVCLGEVHCDLELPNGMPPQVLYDPAQNVAAQPVSVPDGLNDPEAISAFLNDEDSLYTPQYWYRMPTFWAMKGTRPAQLYRQLPRDSGQNEHSLGTIEPPLEVALIIPPALRPWRPELLGNSLFMSDWYKALPPSLPGARSSLWAPFGRVTPYHASILNLLMKFGGGQFECRVRMVNVALRHVSCVFVALKDHPLMPWYTDLPFSLGAPASVADHGTSSFSAPQHLSELNSTGWHDTHKTNILQPIH